MMPLRAREESGTRAGVLGCHAVEVVAKPGQVDGGRTSEDGNGGLRPDEPMPM